MTDRKAEILQAAADLLQTRSFTSFSYQDLSQRLGITKASIHHHFATKEELGVALVERFRAGQKAMLAEIDRVHDDRPLDRLEAFLQQSLGMTDSDPEKICPGGAVQSEINVVPERMARELGEMIREGRAWLTGVLAQGRGKGDLHFAGTAEDQAALIMASLQGGLQNARAESRALMEAIVRQLRGGMAMETTPYLSVDSTTPQPT